MSDIDPVLAEILQYLGETKIRATYGSVAFVVGGTAQSVGGRLGARRREASWVVNAETGMPTGYPPDLLHPDLTSRGDMVREGSDLRRRLDLWKSQRGSDGDRQAP